MLISYWVFFLCECSLNCSGTLRQFIRLSHSNHMKFYVCWYLVSFPFHLCHLSRYFSSTIPSLSTMPSQVEFYFPVFWCLGLEMNPGRRFLVLSFLCLEPFCLCVLHTWRFCAASIECLGLGAFKFLLCFIDSKKWKKDFIPSGIQGNKTWSEKPVTSWGRERCCNTVSSVLCLVLLWQNPRV